MLGFLEVSVKPCKRGPLFCETPISSFELLSGPKIIGHLVVHILKVDTGHAATVAIFGPCQDNA